MPRKDKFHDVFSNALVKDGWIITHDPYNVRFGKQTLFVDLAEESLTAEKDGRRIAVKIKNFLAKREVAEFERALGSSFCIAAFSSALSRGGLSIWR